MALLKVFGKSKIPQESFLDNFQNGVVIGDPEVIGMMFEVELRNVQIGKVTLDNFSSIAVPFNESGNSCVLDPMFELVQYNFVEGRLLV